MTTPTLVDVHTHIYPPSYISLLSSRTSIPYIAQPPPALTLAPSGPATSTTSNNVSEAALPPPRLIILPTDDDLSLPPSERGRPISADYSSIDRKLRFMAKHGIATSVISLANPWLDWVEPGTAAQVARGINEDVDQLCEASRPGTGAADGVQKLYHFATLPVSAPMGELVGSLAHVRGLKHVRGIILGTSGLGEGLDDGRLDPLWKQIEASGLMVFIHPHYGLPHEVFGPKAADSGHVMPLALGFPMETTIAFVRMYLAGVFERFPALKVLLAHAGGTLPFLAGRLESCVLHERHGDVRRRTPIWQVLKRNVWLDGVVYSEVGLKAAIDAVGKEKVLWGTDNPFFPPLEEDASGHTLEGGEWASVRMNVDAAKEAFGEDTEGAEAVLSENAIRVLGLKSGSVR